MRGIKRGSWDGRLVIRYIKNKIFEVHWCAMNCGKRGILATPLCALD